MEVDEMAHWSWWNGKLTKCQNDIMESWWNDNVDKIVNW